MTRASQGTHQRRLEIIADDPTTAHMPQGTIIRLEVPIYPGYKLERPTGWKPRGDLVGQMDFHGIFQRNIHFVGELKCSHGYREKAAQQLYHYERAIKANYDNVFAVAMVYVHGFPFTVELLTFSEDRRHWHTIQGGLR